MSGQTDLNLLQELNVADYAILGIIAVSVLLSLIRGFFREAISLLGWVLAVWLSLSYSARVSALLAPYISVPSARQGAAFVLLFVGTLIVTGLLSFVVGQFVKRTGLSGTDRMLGMLFGAARGLLVVTFLVLLAGFTTLPSDPWWRGSRLVPHVQRAAFEMAAMMPEELKKLVDFSGAGGARIAPNNIAMPRSNRQHPALKSRPTLEGVDAAAPATR